MRFLSSFYAKKANKRQIYKGLDKLRQINALIQVDLGWVFLETWVGIYAGFRCLIIA
jgi:hypothetical protein